MTARLAGFLYVITNATAIFAFVVRGRIITRDSAQTAANILASERLFRIGIVMELLTIAGVMMLVVALYSILEPVHRNAARLATFWRLMENFVLTVVVLFEFAALRLASGTPEAQALMQTGLRVYGDAFRTGFFFLGLGSALFAVLWYKSRLIPRAFAILGIFASLLMAVAQLTFMVFPKLAGTVGMAYMAPMGVFEIGLGFWLLIRGVRVHSERGHELSHGDSPMGHSAA